MKSNLTFLLIVALVSCQTDGNEKPTFEVPKSEVEVFDLKASASPILNEWVSYYKATDVSFSLNNFKKKETVALSFEKGDVFGIYDNEFDTVYKAFLVYSDKGDKYIDFDSYSWSLDENGEFGAEPDQAINLVDIAKKKIQRIGFRGPSQWVEEAFWKNENTVILLENTTENQPVITEIDFQKKKITFYKYKGNVKGKSDYSQQRINKKLNHSK